MLVEPACRTRELLGKEYHISYAQPTDCFDRINMQPSTAGNKGVAGY
jgi:hypothetical protein